MEVSSYSILIGLWIYYSTRRALTTLFRSISDLLGESSVHSGLVGWALFPRRETHTHTLYTARKQLGSLCIIFALQRRQLLVYFRDPPPTLRGIFLGVLTTSFLLEVLCADCLRELHNTTGNVFYFSNVLANKFKLIALASNIYVYRGCAGLATCRENTPDLGF